MRMLLCVLGFLLLLFNSGCKKDPPKETTRSFKMGFQNSAPRQEIDLVLESLFMWTERADAAIISTEVPWDSLLAGTSATDYVRRHYLDLVNYYRDKNLELYVYIDPVNGLDRASDALALQAVGKSITMPECQQLYQDFVLAMNQELNPEHFGFALETNLVRALSPAPLYEAVRMAANNAATAVRAADANVKLSISVQVDWAWGKMDQSAYKGVDQDLADFPFMQELGLSSYPFFVFDKPEDMPDDYYSRISEKANLPVFVAEGGWSSATVDNIQHTPAKQKNYMTRHASILHNADATALFQLTFTDIDVSSLPAGTPAIIELFAFTGLVDVNLEPKPILDEWDRFYKKPYRK